ncbi:amidohydrolase family protein [Hymenobacter humi]|uniref:Amidohydrolase family protein n=1 Tax=Hymenobacter humi TaxID=1411620 RepID=A0ABW2UCE0_9BACT
MDWIKMYGSTGSDKDVTGFQTFTYAEMKAAADVAHFAGKRIAIHSYGPDGARDAVRAGANSVEHAVDVDNATLALMARQGTFTCPLWSTTATTSPTGRNMATTRPRSPT